MSVVAEALSAEEHVVLSDKTDVAGASSALPAVLAELASVSPPEGVWHVVILY